LLFDGKAKDLSATEVLAKKLFFILQVTELILRSLGPIGDGCDKVDRVFELVHAILLSHSIGLELTLVKR
jgi:hypothetical protein